MGMNSMINGMSSMSGMAPMNSMAPMYSMAPMNGMNPVTNGMSLSAKMMMMNGAMSHGNANGGMMAMNNPLTMMGPGSTQMPSGGGFSPWAQVQPPDGSGRQAKPKCGGAATDKFADLCKF
jgi:hypothetical protein